VGHQIYIGGLIRAKPMFDGSWVDDVESRERLDR